MAQTNSHLYVVVDVFTTDPLAGNPLAVFPDASEIDETTMQKIARELNLAETGFVLLQENIVPRDSSNFILEEQVGPVPLRVEAGRRPLIWLQMPPVREEKF